MGVSTFTIIVTVYVYILPYSNFFPYHRFIRCTRIAGLRYALSSLKFWHKDFTETPVHLFTQYFACHVPIKFKQFMVCEIENRRTRTGTKRPSFRVGSSANPFLSQMIWQEATARHAAANTERLVRIFVETFSIFASWTLSKRGFVAT